MASRVVSSSMSAAGSSVLKAWLSGVAIRVGKWNFSPLANLRYSRCSTVPSAPMTALLGGSLDERAGSSHEVVAHQPFPVLGLFDLRNAVRVLILPSTFPRQSGVFAEGLGGDDAQIVVLIDVQPDLVGDVGEGKVVRGCREQQNLRAVGADVLVDGVVGDGGVVAQVVRLIADDEVEPFELGQDLVGHRVGNDPAIDVVLLEVLLPHGLQVLGAEHKGGVVLGGLEHQGGGDGEAESPAEADDVAEHRAAADDAPGEGAHGASW